MPLVKKVVSQFKNKTKKKIKGTEESGYFILCRILNCIPIPDQPIGKAGGPEQFDTTYFPTGECA